MNYIDIKTPNELYQYMKENIRYGLIDKAGKACFRKDLGDELYEKLLYEKAYLQNPDELIKSECGVCYDYVELERSWFLNKGYQVYTFFTPYHNHTILIYQDNNKYYFFERSFKEFNGIFVFNTLEDTLDFYLQRQSSYSIDKIDSITIYPYDDVIFGCGFRDFIENVRSNIQKKIVEIKIGIYN